MKAFFYLAVIMVMGASADVFVCLGNGCYAQGNWNSKKGRLQIPFPAPIHVRRP